MNTQIREQFLDAQRHAVAEAIADGKVVVIAGAMQNNLPDTLALDDRIVLWSSQDNPGRQTLPAHAGCVLYARWISHPDMQSIHKQAMAKGVYSTQQMLQTGEMRQVLEPVVATRHPANDHGNSLAPPTRPVAKLTPIPTKPRPTIRGALTKFVKQHGDPLKMPRQDEARRLLPLCLQAGIHTTEASLKQLLWRLSVDYKEDFSRRGARGGTSKVPAATHAKPFIATPVAAPQSGNTLDFGGAIALIEESIAALTLVKENLVTLQARVDDNAQAKHVLDQLSALLGTKGV